MGRGQSPPAGGKGPECAECEHERALAGAYSEVMKGAPDPNARIRPGRGGRRRPRRRSDPGRARRRRADRAGRTPTFSTPMRCAGSPRPPLCRRPSALHWSPRPHRPPARHRRPPRPRATRCSPISSPSTGPSPRPAQPRRPHRRRRSRCPRRRSRHRPCNRSRPRPSRARGPASATPRPQKPRRPRTSRQCGGDDQDRGPAPSASAEIVVPPVEIVAADAPRHSGRPLGELLVGRGLVSEDQLGEALTKQTTSGKRLGNLLVELGLLGERALTEVLAEQLGLAVVDLSRATMDPEVVALLSEEDARRLERAADTPGRFPNRSRGRRPAGREPRHAAHRSARIAGPGQAGRAERPRTGTRPLLRALGGSRRRAADVRSETRSPQGVPCSRHGRADRRRRERARRQDRQRHPRAGRARPCFRPAHRADGRHRASTGPHRRGAPSDHDAPRTDGPGAHQPDQGHVGHEHRRAPPPAGRADGGHDRQPRPRCARVDDADRVRREVRDAHPRQDARGDRAARRWECRPRPTPATTT